MKSIRLVTLVSFSLLFVSCKKDAADKFPAGNYEVELNVKCTHDSHEDMSEWSFPVRVIESTNSEISVVYERKDDDGNVLHTYPTGYFNIVDKHNVSGEIEKDFFGSMPILFTEGEIKRKPKGHVIEGNVDYQFWDLCYQKWHYRTGTFKFSRE